MEFKKKDLEGFCPVRPHSLRAAFESQLIGKVSDKLIQFFMGHSIGTTGLAYLNKPTEELRKDYMNAEEYLTIEKTSRAELEKKDLKVSVDVERRIKNLEETINDLQRLMEDKIEQVTYKIQQEWLEKHMANIQQEIRDADIARWKEQAKQTEKEREETKQTKETSTKPLKTDEKEKVEPIDYDKEDELLFIGMEKPS